MLEGEDLKSEKMNVHRNWIKHMHECLEKNCIEHFALGLRDLCEEELQDLSKYRWKTKRYLFEKDSMPRYLKFFLAPKEQEMVKNPTVLL